MLPASTPQHLDFLSVYYMSEILFHLISEPEEPLLISPLNNRMCYLPLPPHEIVMYFLSFLFFSEMGGLPFCPPMHIRLFMLELQLEQLLKLFDFGPLYPLLEQMIEFMY